MSPEAGKHIRALSRFLKGMSPVEAGMWSSRGLGKQKLAQKVDDAGIPTVCLLEFQVSFPLNPGTG